jgi:hypothetical protein
VCSVVRFIGSKTETSQRKPRSSVGLLVPLLPGGRWSVSLPEATGS